jgi:hypothetical protein
MLDRKPDAHTHRGIVRLQYQSVLTVTLRGTLCGLPIALLGTLRVADFGLGGTVLRPRKRPSTMATL